MTPDETPKDDVVEETTPEAKPAKAAKAAKPAKASAKRAKQSAADVEATAVAETGEAPEGSDPQAATDAPSEAAEVEATASAAAAESKPAKQSRTASAPKASRQPEPPSKPVQRAASRGRNGRRPAAEPDVLVRAQAKYVRTSARKARLVCDHIRGKDVAEARAILAFTPRQAAKAWSKLLESAVANAENNHELVGEELRIHSVVADEGPTLKRFRPRAMGRATRIRKRTSHLTITLTPKES
jgi:ribosomal protein L22